jgi:hypothetical protein
MAFSAFAACAPADDAAWDVDDPPRHAFTDETPPHMEVPADESTWPTTALPLLETATDAGAPGIVATAAMCGYYQMRMADADVGFHYEYDPVADTYNEADNVHRKAVTVFSLTWLYRFTGRDEFRLNVERGLQHLVAATTEQEDGSLRLSDLGGTSLLIMAMSQHVKLTGTTAWDDTLQRLGTHLLSMIEPDGSFNEGGALSYAQAHLALWRIYDTTGDERYLDTLETVARFFYAHRDDDAWLSSKHLYGLWAHEPLTELYGVRPDAWMPEFVFEVADAVKAGQFTPVDDVDPSWVGGFRESETMPTWRTILKLEGTIDAYRMADWAGDVGRAAAYRKSALIAVQFLQNLQFRAGDTGAHPHPELALGGTPFGFDDPTVRIEVPGHMVNAILKVVAYLDLEDYPGLEG